VKNTEEEIKIIRKRIEKDGVTIEALSASGKLTDFVAALAKEKDADIIITSFSEKRGLKDYLESVYKCVFTVMPDLIRHPEGIENSGFLPSQE